MRHLLKQSAMWETQGLSNTPFEARKNFRKDIVKESCSLIIASNEFSNNVSRSLDSLNIYISKFHSFIDVF